MAMTHDYLDYLNQNVGIAPANSQEELQAAQTIAGLMGQHDVEPQIEEFDAPALAGLTGAVLSVAMFVGVLVSGFGIVPLTLVGLVLALIPAVIAALRLLGREVPLSFGPSARSQNVVACHRATGPLVTKGNRTIVVVAHYDSPHVNFLYSSPVAPYLPLVTKAARWCVFVVALCTLLQVMGFIPEVARRVIWVIGIIAALPSLLLAVGAIAERLAPCTEGANDNKSSVAALLGVLENVRPSGATPKPRPVEPAAAPDVAEPSEPIEPDVAFGRSTVQEPLSVDVQPSSAAGVDNLDEPGVSDETVSAAAIPERPATELVREEVLGVRHGEEVLRVLGMLPDDCQIEYVEPGMVERPVAKEAVRSAGETTALDVPESPASTEADASASATREQLLSTGQFSLVMDEDPRGVGPKDSSGLTNTDSLDADLDATRPAAPAPRPAAPSDPEWGKSSFRPQLSNVARRASLFDLPDPSAADSDPFSTDPNAPRIQTDVSDPAPAASAATPSAPIAAPEPIATIGGGLNDEKPKKHFFSGLLDRIKGHDTESDEQGGSWLGADDSDQDDGFWRGGAAPRSGLRLVEDDEAAPSEEELRDAVLGLGDDALISHDIWFVALGSSALDHAGMRAFLARHRSDVRGCFVVNLDCVGAGNLSVVTREGLEGTRRADRRLGRLLTGSAADLHVSLDQTVLDWTETDATPAMRSSLRSVTLMGVGENGLPALSRTANDTAANVDGTQAAHVAQVVTEMIRRS